MKIEKDEIYTFKLTTGEEVVAKVTELHDNYWEIKHPITMALTPQGLQMMPGLFSANLEKNLQINTSSIVIVAEARDDIRSKYIEVTTGIAPVTKSIITG